jgi:hypothetical protein
MISEFGFRISNLLVPARRNGERECIEMRNPDSGLQHAVLGAVAVALLSMTACGKEGPPLPPVVRVAERTTDLTAFQEGDEAVLKWSYPTMTTAGQNLNDIEEIQVWRAALPLGQEPPPPVSPQDRELRRRLLEGQGEMVQELGTEEIGEATRGSSIVVRDDLERWRQTVDDPESMVLWYGVRTVCCRHRESEFSNVVRLEPQAPPDPPAGLNLTAGSAGIDLSWTAQPGIKTLVERSADGAVWTTVTEDAVGGSTWRDEKAAQGQEWSYRLRSVVALPGGERVVGGPSDPVRVNHPDTYPPAAPSEIVCLPEGEKVRVRWQAVPGAVVYGVTRRHGDEPLEVLTDNHRSIEFTDAAPPLGELVYLVTARDAAGNRSKAASCVVIMGAVP